MSHKKSSQTRGAHRETAIRGHIVTFTGDPFFHPANESLRDIPDGLILVQDGITQAVGPYASLMAQLDKNVVVTTYSDGLITAGFIDMHTHYVQASIIASFGKHLIDWLNHYTFPEEARFSNREYATTIARIFFDELLRNGTTTALVFCSVSPQSVDAFFEEASRRNMRMLGGKVLMDRNAPPPVLDTVQSGYDASKRLIAQWHGYGRNTYAITPRFAPTSSEAQLEAAAALHREHPDTILQTHVSENIAEVDWVQSLYPNRQGYLDVYDHFGLLGSRTVLAHGVHLTARENARCSETGTAIAHCPTSNSFLGSGLFRVELAKDTEKPIRVGLGTDIGAGTRFSMLETMGEAYKVAEMTGFSLDGVKLLYLATLGAAESLGIADKVGSIAVGKEADFVVLDTKATPLLAFRSQQVESLQEQLFLLEILGDDRAVAATYIAGELAYRRARQAPPPHPNKPSTSKKEPV